MHKYNLISILVPAFSVVFIIAAFIFIKPATTGLVIYEPNQSALVNADVILKTKSTEIIPPNAIIQVKIDDKQAHMAVSDFIKKAGGKYEIKTGNLTEFGYYGPGFTGDYTYNLTLENFNLNRNIGKGEHVFITQIIYRDTILYEKENKIMISE